MFSFFRQLSPLGLCLSSRFSFTSGNMFLMICLEGISSPMYSPPSTYTHTCISFLPAPVPLLFQSILLSRQILQLFVFLGFPNKNTPVQSAIAVPVPLKINVNTQNKAEKAHGPHIFWIYKSHTDMKSESSYYSSSEEDLLNCFLKKTPTVQMYHQPQL